MSKKSGMNLIKLFSISTILLLLLSSSMMAQKADYKNHLLSVDKRVDDLMKRMTLEEKVAQLQTSMTLTQVSDIPNIGLGCLTGVFSSLFPTEAVMKYNEIQKGFVEKTRLGIPVLYHGEAVFGLAANGCTAYPQPLAQAATFNLDLHKMMAEAISQEVMSRGHRQVLSPTINVAYDPRWGRTHETYGEDPYLVSLMGLTFIQPIEQAGIVCTPKHFAANIGHNGQFGDAVYFSERFLREVEFPPFKTAVMQGKCRSIMPAYNSINGVPCTSDKWLLNDVLRNEWGFTGFVGSDYGGVPFIYSKHHVAESLMDAAIAALNAGCDVEMPDQVAYQFLVEAVKTGKISEEKINIAVKRILKIKFELGLFENPYIDASITEKTCNSNEHRAIALEIAKQSIVLLKNEQNVLPFSKNIKTIAVLGPLADYAMLGNYAPWGIKTVSILEGIKNKIGNQTQILVEKGVELALIALPVISTEYLTCTENGKDVNGLKAEYFNNPNLEGKPVLTRVDPNINFEWGEGVPHPFLNADNFSVRWIGKLKSPKTGIYRFGMSVDDGVRVYIDNKLIIDEWKNGGVRLIETNFAFEKDKVYDIKIECFDGLFSAVARLGWNQTEGADIPKAIEAAKKSDAIIIVCGATDGEGKDRANLDLTNAQVELISQIATLGKPFVVILATGNVITMNDWVEKAPCILETWYSGEEGGTAIADVLFGDYNPGGKLPVTFPKTTGQLPCYYHKTNIGIDASFINYGNAPLFPFGHGLSYTTFGYSSLSLSSDKIKAGENITVKLTITNTGKVKGDEVVQLYIKDFVGSVSRPAKLLRGFQRISLKAGETKNIEFTITPEALSMWNSEMKWVVEPGKFEVQIGSSSEDIRLKQVFEVRITN